MPNPITAETLPIEDRLEGVTVEAANICQRMGVSPKAIKASLIANAERDGSSDPALRNLIVALKVDGKDPATALRFSTASGRLSLELKPGVTLGSGR